MKLLLLLLALPMIGFGQNVNIPDANFKAALVNNASINTNMDTEIQISEAAAYTGGINVSNSGIINLTGIGAFTFLNTLYCFNNQLTSLDVSTCAALNALFCFNNQLISLDISTCAAIYVLDCSNNNLTSLNISTCAMLSDLYCFNNQLTSLDVSSCTVLTALNCNDNNLTNLNLSTCPALNFLDCSNNNLTSLNVSNGIALTDLECNDNQLTSLDVSICTELTDLECNDNQLTSLDVSFCTALNDLYCYDNQLTSLNVKNGNNINMDLYAITNPNLSCIEVDNVAWSTANWVQIDAASSFSLNCSGAGISDINESNTLLLYPNPTNGDFTITGLELVGTVSSLILTDMNGKVVKVLDTKATKFSMSSIKPGVYFLNIISGNKEEVLKIVKE